MYKYKEDQFTAGIIIAVIAAVVWLISYLLK